jgi:hypothetical protein
MEAISRELESALAEGIEPPGPSKLNKKPKKEMKCYTCGAVRNSYSDTHLVMMMSYNFVDKQPYL